MLTREIHNLRHLGLGYLIGVYAAHTDTLVVDMQHDPRGFFPPLIEMLLDHMHHELHRRVIVIEQQHLVKMRPLCFRARFGDKSGTTIFLMASVRAFIRSTLVRPVLIGATAVARHCFDLHSWLHTLRV